MGCNIRLIISMQMLQISLRLGLENITELEMTGESWYIGIVASSDKRTSVGGDRPVDQIPAQLPHMPSQK